MKKFTIFTMMAAATMFANAQRPTSTEEPNRGKLAQNVTLAPTAHAGIAKAKAATTVEFSDIISEMPEGEVKSYVRYGSSFFSYYGYIYFDLQNGIPLDLVMASDGKTVYLKDPIANLQYGNWVKGTIEENQIHLPLYQTLCETTDGVFGLVKSDMVDNGDGSVTWIPDYEATEVIFTIEEDGTLKLQGTEANETGYGSSLLAAIDIATDKWTGFGDFETVFVPLTDEIMSVPKSVEFEDFTCKDDNGVNLVKVGIEGDRIYILDLFTAPLVGTIEGDKVTFATDQYLGLNRGYYEFATTANYEIIVHDDGYYWEEVIYHALPSLEYVYDAENKTIAPAAEKVAFVSNRGKSDYGISTVSTYYREASFKPFVEVAEAPVTPYFYYYSGEYYGQWGFYFFTPNETVSGEYIMKDKLEWAVYTDEDIFTFTADDGYALSEDMTWFPTGFVDDNYGWDIFCDGDAMLVTLYMYTTLCNEVGIQSRATFDGVIYYSDICYCDVKTGETRVVEYTDPVGINNVATRPSVRLFDLQGRRMEKMSNGLMIRNGKVVFMK